MSGSQKFSHNFRRKVLSNFLRMSNVCEGMSSDYKNLSGFLGNKFSEPACANYNIALLSTTWKFYASYRTAGTVSNGLMPGSQKYSPKCHRLFKRIRCFLRNVKQFQKNYLFLLLLDNFSGSLIRSVEFIGVDNRAILWYAQARRICPLKNQINFWKLRENF